MRVYTESYQPFRMGGPYIPIAIDVEPTRGPIDIGCGYKAYVVMAPNGTTFVAEAITGAFVGPNIRQVRRDIKTGDPAMMKQQIKEAKERMKHAETVSQDKFWAMLRCL